MMQDYDITVAVGASRQLDAQGEYFYYNAGSAGGADPTIKLRGLSSGLTIKLKPGQGFRLHAGEKETSWVITNFAGAATIIGFVTVGNGDITDNRITGSVEVVDGGKNRTNAGSAFSATGNTLTTLGTYPCFTLWNPSNSGKNIFVKSSRFSTNTTQDYGIQHVTSLGTGQLTGSGAGYVTGVAPKKIGSASVGIPYVSTTNNFNGMGSSMSLITATLLAATIDQYKFDEPAMIQPNSGIQAFAVNGNTKIIATFEYYEESI